jgi:hypothetical protein
MKITSGNVIESKIPEVDFSNSENFYRESLNFTPGIKVIHFITGFKCNQCKLKSRQPYSQVAYCFVHKRIVDGNETCSQNTRITYKNVNFR